MTAAEVRAGDAGGGCPASVGWPAADGGAGLTPAARVVATSEMMRRRPSTERTQMACRRNRHSLEKLAFTGDLRQGYPRSLEVPAGWVIRCDAGRPSAECAHMALKDNRITSKAIKGKGFHWSTLQNCKRVPMPYHG
eukprot:954095-Pelagomonas_calceolata.AAC.4